MSDLNKVLLIGRVRIDREDFGQRFLHVSCSGADPIVCRVSDKLAARLANQPPIYMVGLLVYLEGTLDNGDVVIATLTYLAGGKRDTKSISPEVPA